MGLTNLTIEPEYWNNENRCQFPPFQYSIIPFISKMLFLKKNERNIKISIHLIMRILTITICSCITIFCFGQSNLITEIRNHYNDVNKLIINCQKSNENSAACELYKNEISINSDNLTWPGSGKYTKKIIFWYDYPPGNCDECGENGINVLLKIEITVWVASMYTFKANEIKKINPDDRIKEAKSLQKLFLSCNQ